MVEKDQGENSELNGVRFDIDKWDKNLSLSLHGN